MKVGKEGDTGASVAGSEQSEPSSLPPKEVGAVSSDSINQTTKGDRSQEAEIDKEEQAPLKQPAIGVVFSESGEQLRQQHTPGIDDEPGRTSFNQVRQTPKGNRSEEQKAEKEGQAPPPQYSIDVYDRAAGAQLQQLCRQSKGPNLHFYGILRAIAADADGLGPGAPDPIVALAQREADFGSLALLVEELEEDPTKPIHTVSISTRSTVVNSPEHLASWLALELANERLMGVFILLILPSWAVTSSWEAICHDTLESPLKQFLSKAGKRLIVGIEPPPHVPMSRLVNSDTGISAVPWGAPLLARIAQQSNFRIAHIDHALVQKLDKESAWRSFQDDRREIARFVQFAGIPQKYRDRSEMESTLHSLLEKKDPNLEDLWKLSEARAADAMGFARDSLFPNAPAAIKQGLLCSAAFATGLPSSRFLAIVSASLPKDQTVGLADVTKEEHDKILELAGLQGSEHKTMPPMPTIREYFVLHADRICQAYEIETDADGNMGLGPSWSAFPLARHICTKAPSMAIEYTKRLLSAENDIGELRTVEVSPLVRMIAVLQCHLRSGVSQQQLAFWLIACAQQSLAHPFPSKNVEIDPRLTFAEAIAGTVIAFLAELRKAAASAGIERSVKEEAGELRQAVLILIADWQDSVTLAMTMILMDTEAQPGEHESLEPMIGQSLLNQRGLDFVVNVAAKYFSQPLAGGSEARCASACRLLEFFDRAARRPSSRLAWKTACDRILSILLNYDIRWPPSTGGLLDYQFHHKRVALELIVQGQVDGGSSAIVKEGSRIVMQRFLGYGPSNWLAGSWENWVEKEAPQRLYDTVLVLLDGPPATSQYWKNRSFEETADKVMNSLLVECGVNSPFSLAVYVESLAACSDHFNPSSACRPYLKLYGLFWPALLLFWRLRLFGVEPLGAAGPRVEPFKEFLGQFCRQASPATVATVADGMGCLATALERAVIAAMVEQSDPVAYKFYIRKHDAAEKLANYLRKRLPPAERPSGRVIDLSSRHSNKRT